MKMDWPKCPITKSLNLVNTLYVRLQYQKKKLTDEIYFGWCSRK